MPALDDVAMEIVAVHARLFARADWCLARHVVIIVLAEVFTHGAH